jgi:hypothetical protein
MGSRWGGLRIARCLLHLHLASDLCVGTCVQAHSEQVDEESQRNSSWYMVHFRVLFIGLGSVRMAETDKIRFSID